MDRDGTAEVVVLYHESQDRDKKPGSDLGTSKCILSIEAMDGKLRG
jgi:hypothetical protein